MTSSKSELSRLVDINDIKDHKGLTLDVRATPDECKALAKRYNILDVNDFNAHLKLALGATSDLIRVEGDLIAHVVQECCVTLAPVMETVHESFEELLTTSAAKLGTGEEEEADNDDRPVDLIEGQLLDIGEVLAQWLALSLNPFPRSDAPLYEHLEEGSSDTGEGTHKPFQVLETLKGNK